MIYIGFTTPNQMMFDKYARHGEGQFMVADRADVQLFARVYDGYLSGGMHPKIGPLPEAWWLRLCSIDSGKMVDVATGPKYEANTALLPYANVDGHYANGTTVAGVFTQTSNMCRWTIKRGVYPDGNYEVTSNLPGTMGFTLQIRNSVVTIPPSKYMLQRPAYMPGMGGFPTNIKTNIIEFQGVREKDTAPPVPFADAGTFTAPFVHGVNASALWSESFGCNVPDYDGCAWPSASPIGGLHYVANQRYTINDYASVAPDVEASKSVASDSSPAERLDGGPGTGGVAVAPSGFRTAQGEIYILASTGSIIHVDKKTRALKTVYGWVKKPGTPQPVAHGLAPMGAERETHLRKYFDFIGTGPTISRAWQMCNVGNFAYVVEPTNHTVVQVDLATGIGRTLAGTVGSSGSADGLPGVAQFNQPRGITYLSSGPYAGNFVVADEHNSAYRLVDALTGAVTTLTQAKKIPIHFPGDFTGELTRTVNRLTFGAPTNQDGTYNTAFKVQPFADAQFCHPCHLCTLSDGKTVVGVHHDEYRGFRLDLEAKTITHLFDLDAAASRPDVSPKDWPTIHVDTPGSMGLGIDTLWVCSWHYNNQQVYSSAGVKVFGAWISWGTCGDHRGLRHNAYSRSMIVLGDGSFIFNGDGQNSLQRVRKALPTDPTIDRAGKYARGDALYRADGPRLLSGPNRPSVMTVNGTVGLNYLVQLKTVGELAMLSRDARKAYMIDKFGVTDWSDENHDDVAYYLNWNCSQGVQRLRDPNWTGAAPIPVAPPVVIPGTVTNTAPVDSTAKQQLGFDAALAQVRAGIAMERLAGGATLTSADVAAVDWVAT